jgi:adenylate cyclase class 2
MGGAIEREIKLRFPGASDARATVLAAGASQIRERRLQQDCLLDTVHGLLRDQRSSLRLRMDSGRALVTFKGPVLPSVVKMREEVETVVGDGPRMLQILEKLGFRVWFRYEKYREEFALDDVVVAIDDTPIGTFVEIEGSDLGIAAAARALGRKPADYVLDSYRGLFVRYCEENGMPATHMLFELT